MKRIKVHTDMSVSEALETELTNRLIEYIKLEDKGRLVELILLLIKEAVIKPSSLLEFGSLIHLKDVQLYVDLNRE